jgi:hypothetical protein
MSVDENAEHHQQRGELHITVHAAGAEVTLDAVAEMAELAVFGGTVALRPQDRERLAELADELHSLTLVHARALAILDCLPCPRVAR